MFARFFVTLVLVSGLLLAGCGTLQGDLLVVKTADPHITLGFRLLPGPGESVECYIKGNISASGEKIYHMPNGASYEQVVINLAAGERIFCSEQAAVDAGFRKALR